MKGVVFVTGNQHKADYVARLLDMPIDHQKLDLDEIQSVDSAVVGAYKARQAYKLIGRPVLIDDFGMAFEALDGLPGPFIKFFIEINDGLEKLCRLLDPFESRAATAICTMAYCDENGLKVFRRNVEGVIVDHPRGSLGIGTDSIFAPLGYDGRTRAELSQKEYNEVYMKVRPIEEVKQFLMSRDENR